MILFLDITLCREPLGASGSDGSDSYRFLVEPSARHRRFHDMIMDTDLVEGGVSLFDSMCQERHREAMDDLFDKIINTPAEHLS